jgi:hypothetical protein
MGRMKEARCVAPGASPLSVLPCPSVFMGHRVTGPDLEQSGSLALNPES